MNPALQAQSFSTKTCILYVFESFLRNSWENGANVNRDEGRDKKADRETRVWFSPAGASSQSEAWLTGWEREGWRGASIWGQQCSYQSTPNVGETHEQKRILSWFTQWNLFILPKRLPVKYSIGSLVNNIVITTCGATWILKIPGESFCKVYDCLTMRWYTWN